MMGELLNCWRCGSALCTACWVRLWSGDRPGHLRWHGDGRQGGVFISSRPVEDVTTRLAVDLFAAAQDRARADVGLAAAEWIATSRPRSDGLLHLAFASLSIAFGAPPEWARPRPPFGYGGFDDGDHICVGASRSGASRAAATCSSPRRWPRIGSELMTIRRVRAVEVVVAGGIQVETEQARSPPPRCDLHG